MMRAALFQKASGDSEQENLLVPLARPREAATALFEFLLTPRITKCISTNRCQQYVVLQTEIKDQTLVALKSGSTQTGIWLLIALRSLETGAAEECFANRFFLVVLDGNIRACHHKIQIFDVAATLQETYCEADSYLSNDRMLITQTTSGCLGITVFCYLRFQVIYQARAQSGAEILIFPSSFSLVMGAAHWTSIQKTREIATGYHKLVLPQRSRYSQKRANRVGLLVIALQRCLWLKFCMTWALSLL